MGKKEVMGTPELRSKINQAILELTSLFEVAEEDFLRFSKPTIKREISSNLLDIRPSLALSPAYSYSENVFYFPCKNELQVDIFSPAIIHHEASHYLHNCINPQFKREALPIFLKTCEQQGPNDLQELVAEYGNMILGLGDYSDPFNFETYKKYLKVYERYGPEFLPRLARMSLEEAIKEKIVIL